jgi:shikimate dehydrogenase
MSRRLLIGLIGSNILKSLSPALHEDALGAAGLVGHYHLMDLPASEERKLPDLLQAVKTVGFAGINVTLPYKQSIIPLLDEVSSEARQIGAVNTVTIDQLGRTIGYNTDRVGFRRSFEETLARKSSDRKTAVLIGAGGAGRAVAFALMDLGIANLLIHDLDMARATALAADIVAHFGPRAMPLENPDDGVADADGVVNATPIGMHGIPGEPLPLTSIDAHHWVADVIYTPLETELIKAAKSRGAMVMNGGGMCVHQAAEAFRLFTGKAPDVSRLHRVFAGAVAARETDDSRGARP